MKSAQKASKESGIDVTLIRSVVRRLGDRSYLEDVYNHGADAGFPGFTYYTDTESFWKKHREVIAQLVKDTADSLGESPAEVIAGFRCLQNVFENDYEKMQDIYSALGNGTPEEYYVPNALVWFALEEVARAMCEE